MKQLKFQTGEFKLSRPFGGSLLTKARNRTARPLTTKKSMHLVLRSSKAVGDWSFKKPANQRILQEALKKAAHKFGVKIYDCANGGNHIHLIVKLGNRYAYNGFIRALTGTLALKIAGWNRFNKSKLKFWDFRPFSRIVEWGRAYAVARDYLLLNRLESLGILPYVKNRLKDVALHPFEASD